MRRLLQHGSARNVTGGFRRAISTHYVSVDCDFFDTTLDPVQRSWAERVASKKRSNAVFKADKPFTHQEMYRKQMKDGGRNSGTVFGRERADDPDAV